MNNTHVQYKNKMKMSKGQPPMFEAINKPSAIKELLSILEMIDLCASIPWAGIAAKARYDLSRGQPPEVIVKDVESAVDNYMGLDKSPLKYGRVV